KVMPNLILPLSDDISANFFENEVYKAEYFTKLLDLIPLKNLSLPNRAALIEKLTSIDQVNRTSLLVDKNNKRIPKNEVSFTPRKQSEVAYAVPKYARIHFINTELYDNLIHIF